MREARSGRSVRAGGRSLHGDQELEHRGRRRAAARTWSAL